MLFGPTLFKLTPFRPVLNTMLQVRTKMKSHKASMKRFIKTGTGYKRKQAGRNHGNGRFCASSMAHLNHFVTATNKGGQIKKLEKFW